MDRNRRFEDDEKLKSFLRGFKLKCVDGSGKKERKCRQLHQIYLISNSKRFSFTKKGIHKLHYNK